MAWKVLTSPITWLAAVALLMPWALEDVAGHAAVYIKAVVGSASGVAMLLLHPPAKP